MNPKLTLAAFIALFSFASATVDNCQTPDPINANRCLQCIKGYYLQGNTWGDYCYLCSFGGQNVGCSACNSSTVCTECANSTYTLFDDNRCYKKCDQQADCANMQESGFTAICEINPSKSTEQKYCDTCANDGQCEAGFPGMGFKCMPDKYNPDKPSKRYCGQCNSDNDCPNNLVCDRYNVWVEGLEASQCKECLYDSDCRARFSDKQFCSANKTCIDTCKTKQADSCGEVAAEQGCGCRATYWRKNCFMECNSIDIDGTCAKTWNGWACRNELEDLEDKYRPGDRRCFHSSTVVRVQTSDGSIVERHLNEVWVGDMLQVSHGQSEESLPKYEPVIAKLSHKNDTLSEVLRIQLADEKVLKLTKGHFTLILRNGSIQHVPSESLTTQDFLIVNSLPVTIISISLEQVNSGDLVHVYTPSGKIIVNGGILASCKSEYDLSEYHLPILSFLHSYISPALPQKLVEMASYWKLAERVKYVAQLF